MGHWQNWALRQGFIPHPRNILGFGGIGLAVALREGSTLVVVANALRLLGYDYLDRFR
jgi:cation transport ATPase